MRFIPNHTFRVIPESDYAKEMATVNTLLENCRQQGSFSAFDGVNIYYEYFLAEGAKANIVIVHGLKEYTKKFYEIVYYFLNQGYNVFIYDQRCHGLSDRLTPHRERIHVDSFWDYVKDLDQFIEQVVLPAQQLPVYLYGHSMGGAVCVMYMEKHPQRAAKAVLSAPLFAPVVDGVPGWIALSGVIFCKLFKGAKGRFFLASEFDPNVRHDQTYCSSPARFYYHHQQRLEKEDYRCGTVSYSWAQQSLLVRRKVMGKRRIKRLKAPILLISAEQDRTVQTRYHKVFASKHSNCRMELLREEKHPLLDCKDAHMKRQISWMLDFYEQ